jgi:phage portal protein BeeE
VISGTPNWIKIGLSPEEIGILDIKKDTEITICNGLGIPPSLVGIIDPKFSNYESINENFYKNIIPPFVKSIIEKINRKFNCKLEVLHEI